MTFFEIFIGSCIMMTTFSIIEIAVKHSPKIKNDNDDDAFYDVIINN